jgi:ABC-type antimicrobial peptide transport system permease subunit
MLQDYLRITFRRFFKAKLFSIINITGLSLGLTCCLLIGTHIVNELTYDQFHVNSDRVYRMNLDLDFGGSVYHMPQSPVPLAGRLREFESVEDATGIYKISSALLQIEVNEQQDRFLEKGGYAVDASFFDIFTFPLIKGSNSGLFEQPNQMVISKSLSSKFFGDWESGMNKVIRIDNSTDYQVVGIIDDVPENSNLAFDYLVPFDFVSNTGHDIDRWDRIFSYNYVLLKNKDSMDSFNASLQGLIVSLAEAKEDQPMLYPQNINDIHLSRNTLNGTIMSDFGGGLVTPGDLSSLRLYGGIGLLILAIAIINFMNLSTAMFVKRTKDIGLRKAVGASRLQLIFNYLGESIMFALTAMVLALLLTDLLMPTFNALLGGDLSFELLFTQVSSSILITGLLVFTIVSGVLAGAYPAVFITKFSPKDALRKDIKFGRKGLLQKSLVIGQFAAAIVFIIGSFVVNKQLRFVQDLNLGFDKEQLIYVDLKGGIREHTDAVLSALNELSVVEEVTFTQGFPDGISGRGTYDWQGKSEDNEVVFDMINADPNFTSTFKIAMKEGYTMPIIGHQDTTEYYLLNEQALKELLPDFEGDEEQVIGSKLEGGVIAGVVKDFRAWPAYRQIQPMVISLNNSHKRMKAVIRVKPGTSTETVAALKEVFERHNPDYPMELSFVDEVINSRYKAAERTQDIYTAVSFLAIVISCLGLFGLAAFAAEQRTKEIGIRKVLGATVNSILALVSREFVLLVGLAFILAIPLAYMSLESWLNEFHERIQLDVVPFVIGGCIALILAYVTVGLQVIKAARVNPAHTLKDE